MQVALDVTDCEEYVTARNKLVPIDAVDSFAASQDDTPSRPEAIRRLLRDHLIGLGVMPWDDSRD